MPSSTLAWAAAFFRMPIAFTTSWGIRSTPGHPMEKWWMERSVWAPQYLVASTSMAPIESVSVRYSVMVLPSGRSRSGEAWRHRSLGRAGPDLGLTSPFAGPARP